MRSVACHLLVVVLGLSLAAAGPAHAAAEPSTAAIDRATARWKSVAGDRRARLRRDRWESVLAGLERAAAGAACPARATAYARAGAAAVELFEVSRIGPDLARAEALHVQAAEACPGDVSVAAAWRGAAAVARRRGAGAALVRRYEAHARAAAPRPSKDGKAATVRAPAAAPRSAAPIDRAAARAALDRATAAWKALRGDASRRLVRRHWLDGAQALEAVGNDYAPAPEAALAFMRAGKAAEELSRLSKRPGDARDAVRLFVAVADRCPDASLADDALLAAAALEESRLGRLAEARRHLVRAAALNEDLAAEAARRLAALGPEVPETTQESAAPVAPAARPASAGTAAEAVELGALLAALELPARPAPGTLPQAATADGTEALRELRSAAGEVELSLSEQVGLKIRRIVIDAGHGGHDTGAIGPTGVREKDVTLAIARTLAAELRERGYEVVLTRDDDVFLALEERTSLANRARGDLFISVHANAHRSRRKGGVETYTLNVTSNRYAIRLAARENATTERSVSDLQFVLADLAMRSNTVDSGRLARLVQRELVDRTRRVHGPVRDLGTKQALFYVLLGARMPAILVETAFLSNPIEEKRLGDAKFQATVAGAIADGVDAFVARRLRLATADR